MSPSTGPAATFAASLLLAGLAWAADSAFSESACFERWSHFKDYGVPGTPHDPVNQAMIADGSCRLLGQPLDGYHAWHDADRTRRVLDALAAAPATSNPSHFTLETRKALKRACLSAASADEVQAAGPPPSFDETAIAASMQKWLRALCAAESDAAWQGFYDPAYQPQQVALTAGFMCIVACDSNGLPLPAAALASFASTDEAAAKTQAALCDALPFGSVDFLGASLEELAALARPLLLRPCSCARAQSWI